MGTVDSPSKTASNSNKARLQTAFQKQALIGPRVPSTQHRFENQNKPKTPNNGFKIYQIPSHIVEAVEFPEIEKMKEDVPDYEMFQPGQVYDDSFDDENDTVALIDDDYIGLVSIGKLRTVMGNQPGSLNPTCPFTLEFSCRSINDYPFAWVFA